MKIGGLQPVTLLDYPHKISAIIFASGCNMRCPFCYNPRLVVPKLIKKNKLVSNTELMSFLQGRKKYLDGVVITGGEPTLQSKLIEFCRQIKEMGYDIKLDTNGLEPKILKKLVEEKLVDYIAMDIKGPLDDLKKYSGTKVKAKKIKSSIEIIKKSNLPYEFRSTLVKGLHTKGDVKKMAQAVSGVKMYWLQNFNVQKNLVDQSFVGKSFTKVEMDEFKKIVEKYVEKCSIR